MGYDAEKGSSINWRNFALCFMLSLGQFGMGYPSSVISVIIENPDWQATMGLVDSQGNPTPDQAGLIGATNGIFQAGAVINTVLTVIILDRFGRKMSIYYNSILGLFGGGMACGAMNIGTFIAARFFLGASAWGFLTLTPIFTAELSPPNARGFFSGMNGFNISFGYAIAGYMGLAFSYSDSPEATWRGPLGIYLIIPLMLLVIGFVAPESPRWLLMQGRTEEARNVTYKIHRVGDNTDFAEEEFYQMEKQTEIDRRLETSWISMFTKTSYRKRAQISCLYSFLGQSTAVLVINNYGITFYESLGYGTHQQLVFQIGWLTVGFPFCFLGAFLMDKAGRRPLMIGGIGGCCCCVIVLAAASAQLEMNPSYTQMGALGVAALYVFLALYSIGVDVVFYAEVFPNHIRSKGVALANVVLALSDLVYLQVTPTAIANIGWKWYLLFIILSGLGAIALFFLLPETKGMALEDIGRLFGDTDVAVYSENVHFDEKHRVSVGGGENKKEDSDEQSNGHTNGHSTPSEADKAV